MLKIGKADLYFTLWDVSSTNNYATDLSGKSYLSYISTWYQYKQNLSLDETKAIAKAVDFGVTDLVPDEELRGKRNSWKARKYFDVPIVENVFTFGKYRGKLFVEGNDVSYMKWYYGEDNFASVSSKNTLRNRIVELDPETYCIYNDELETVEFREKMETVELKMAEIEKTGSIEVFVDRNIDGYDKVLYADGMYFMFENVKENFYNGYSYYLPMFDGKAKRIKNKNVKFSIERKATENEPFDWVVKSMEVIKK